MRKIQIWL